MLGIDVQLIGLEDLEKIKPNLHLITYGYNFQQFMFENLKISKKDENTPLYQIYAKRYKSQSYRDTVAKYHVLLNQQLKIRSEKNQAKKKTRTASAKTSICKDQSRKG